MVTLGAAESDLSIDWSRWDSVDAPQAGTGNVTASMEPEILWEGCSAAQALRHLVNECALRAAFPGDICAYTEEPVLEHDYQVPFIESGGLDCGFEVRLGFLSTAVTLTLRLQCWVARVSGRSFFSGYK